MSTLVTYTLQALAERANTLKTRAFKCERYDLQMAEQQQQMSYIYIFHKFQDDSYDFSEP